MINSPERWTLVGIAVVTALITLTAIVFMVRYGDANEPVHTAVTHEKVDKSALDSLWVADTMVYI